MTPALTEWLQRQLASLPPIDSEASGLVAPLLLSLAEFSARHVGFQRLGDALEPDRSYDLHRIEDASLASLRGHLSRLGVRPS